MKFSALKQNLGNLLDLFVLDPQDDCDCDFENYDTYAPNKSIILNNGIAQIYETYTIIKLPMQKELITKSHVLSCINLAINQANISSNDSIYNRTLLHSQNTIYDNYKNYIIDNINGIYSIPDPEFFGVITWNINKFGMFIHTNNIIKIL